MLLLSVALVTAVVLPGCNCLQPTVTKKKKEKKEKPKPPFEVSKVEILPGGMGSINLVKPGHWITTSQQLTSNTSDFDAIVYSAATNTRGQPLDVERTQYTMSTTRPAKLPKEQAKTIENIYYVPRRLDSSSKKVWLQSKVRDRRTGREVPKAGSMEATTIMEPYEYSFMVLSNRASTFSFLKTLDSLAVRSTEAGVNIPQPLRVALPKIGRRVPVPSHPLTWSSIAYVMWDDLRPGQLLGDQQTALLDWLHFGGQLIISGPQAMDALKGEFLERYLPCEGGAAVELAQAAFDGEGGNGINDKWSLYSKQTKKRETLEVLPGKPLVGIELTLKDTGYFVPGTNSLVAERRVGRGRVVVTSFSLSDPQLTSWRCFDNFFNGCMLRRPGREYVMDKDLFITRSKLVDSGTLPTDARISTTLRYFTRDIGHTIGSAGETTAGIRTTARGNVADVLAEDEYGDPVKSEVVVNIDPDIDGPYFGGFRQSAQSGIAGWDDFSGASDGARQSLRDAAGISIPKASFVLRMMAVYLLVLVPVNWGFFRLIRRVEWAWAAAPFIAIAGAIAVIQFAQLDIGFARSRTEIAVIETHGGYTRSHLTRYSALYTSLSTEYSIRFDEQSALAQPFSINPTFRRTAQAIPVSFRRQADVELSGFRVESNTTGMMHSEQMFALGGPFKYRGDKTKGFSLTNETRLPLKDAIVLRRTGRNKKHFEYAWVGGLSQNKTVVLKFKPATAANFPPPQWRESEVCWSVHAEAKGIMQEHDGSDGSERDNALTRAELPEDSPIARLFVRVDRSPADGNLNLEEVKSACRRLRDGEVSLGEIFDLAVDRLRLNQGDVRLIGWTDQDIPGIEFSPAANQVTLRTAVISHLQHCPLPALKSDKNLKSDVAEAAKEINDRDVDLFKPR